MILSRNGMEQTKKMEKPSKEEAGGRKIEKPMSWSEGKFIRLQVGGADRRKEGEIEERDVKILDLIK